MNCLIYFIVKHFYDTVLKLQISYCYFIMTKHFMAGFLRYTEVNLWKKIHLKEKIINSYSHLYLYYIIKLRSRSMLGHYIVFGHFGTGLHHLSVCLIRRKPLHLFQYVSFVYVIGDVHLLNPFVLNAIPMISKDELIA